ncbi:hypothetical protein [Herbaspirillum rhizosphaerae]|uniref:hypothetical protein n=1 Tax=Herbaspirillum rhizosphaerae TaxID=346179 RepID=UPI00067DFC51|nr:hypothetical protein [Herbaspirillum rhizosphaerae]
MATFIPEANKSYRIDPAIVVFQDKGLVPMYTSATCQMKIIDVETGKLASTYEVAPMCPQPKR